MRSALLARVEPSSVEVEDDCVCPLSRRLRRDRPLYRLVEMSERLPHMGELSRMV